MTNVAAVDPGPPPQQGQRMSEEEAARVRTLLGKCYDDDLFPEDIGREIGTVVHEDYSLLALFILDDDIDDMIIDWLKAQTVIVLSMTQDQTLSLANREQLIRIYEDGWYRDPNVNPSAKRGRTHGEGPNVMSYVARSTQIAQWLTTLGSVDIPCHGGTFKVLFKPWMTRAELEQMREQEQAARFRLIALRVPLVAMFSLMKAIQRTLGPVLKMHPPDKKEDEPMLGNVKIDCDPTVRNTYRDQLYIRSKDGADLKIRIASQDSPFCKKCLWWFHTEEDPDCPRYGEEMPAGRRRGRGGGRGRGEGRGDLWSNSTVWRINSQLSLCDTGKSSRGCLLPSKLTVFSCRLTLVFIGCGAQTAPRSAGQSGWKEEAIVDCPVFVGCGCPGSARSGSALGSARSRCGRAVQRGHRLRRRSCALSGWSPASFTGRCRCLDDEECEGQDGEGGGWDGEGGGEEGEGGGEEEEGGGEGDDGKEGDVEGKDDGMDEERDDVGEEVEDNRSSQFHRRHHNESQGRREDDAYRVGDAIDAGGQPAASHGMSQSYDQTKDRRDEPGSRGKRKRGKASISPASRTKLARDDVVNEACGALTASQEARAPKKTTGGGAKWQPRGRSRRRIEAPKTKVSEKDVVAVLHQKTWQNFMRPCMGKVCDKAFVKQTLDNEYNKDWSNKLRGYLNLATSTRTVWPLVEKFFAMFDEGKLPIDNGKILLEMPGRMEGRLPGPNTDENKGQRTLYHCIYVRDGPKGSTVSWKDLCPTYFKNFGDMTCRAREVALFLLMSGKVVATKVRVTPPRVNTEYLLNIMRKERYMVRMFNYGVFRAEGRAGDEWNDDFFMSYKDLEERYASNGLCADEWEKQREKLHSNLVKTIPQRLGGVEEARQGAGLGPTEVMYKEAPFHFKVFIYTTIDKLDMLRAEVKRIASSARHLVWDKLSTHTTLLSVCMRSNEVMAAPVDIVAAAQKMACRAAIVDISAANFSSFNPVDNEEDSSDSDLEIEKDTNATGWYGKSAAMEHSVKGYGTGQSEGCSNLPPANSVASGVDRVVCTPVEDDEDDDLDIPAQPTKLAPSDPIPPRFCAYANNVYFVDDKYACTSEDKCGHDIIWHDGIFEPCIRGGEWKVAVKYVLKGWRPFPRMGKDNWLKTMDQSILYRCRKENPGESETSIAAKAKQLFDALGATRQLEYSHKFYELQSRPSYGKIDWKVEHAASLESMDVDSREDAAPVLEAATGSTMGEQREDGGTTFGVKPPLPEAGNTPADKNTIRSISVATGDTSQGEKVSLDKPADAGATYGSLLTTCAALAGTLEMVSESTTGMGVTGMSLHPPTCTSKGDAHCATTLQEGVTRDDGNGGNAGGSLRSRNIEDMTTDDEDGVEGGKGVSDPTRAENEG
ncbi:hypothetical protein CBR_g32585 [Chara braunii]|uniref:Uncharacterized protein n=1 Tax=Chara braunii TaxID=69332 RepID=A0A388LH88_CHABU|nr:hypothetical protein CBR_g32585 [Chara braunii]|eukprot:GBG81593.1 hypothetical protein CBR_g32585 [Chara braunii]